MFIFRGGLNPQTASPQQMQSNMELWFAWVNELKEKGIYTAGEALMPTGKTVMKKGLVTDGPFAESKELIGGFFIVKAKDIDAAVALAQSCPDLPLGGTVEVRDVVVFE